MHTILPNGEDIRGAWLWGRTPWWGVSGVGLHQEGAIGGWVARDDGWDHQGPWAHTIMRAPYITTKQAQWVTMVERP